jgi:hypothetical protein
MSDLISRKALLEELKNTYVPVSVKLIDLITNAPAIEQGEPVAYIHKHYLNEDKNALDWHKREHPQFEMISLYTAPPQPQEVKDALEKAAKICEKMQKDENNTHIGERCSYGTCQIQGSTFAKAIRALIEKG